MQLHGGCLDECWPAQPRQRSSKSHRKGWDVWSCLAEAQQAMISQLEDGTQTAFATCKLQKAAEAALLLLEHRVLGFRYRAVSRVDRGMAMSHHMCWMD